MQGPRAAETSRGRVWLGQFSVSVATEFGPRVTGLRLAGGPNLLAELGPDIRIENPDLGDYHFRGGHRLWVAPEVPEVTHVPDEIKCEVTVGGTSIMIDSGSDQAGFAKTLTLTGEGNQLVVDHTLTWTGSGEVDASPWAITQFPVGGTAILPLRPLHGRSGLQADRSIVLWPYTNLSDPRITITDKALLLDARAGGQIKVGIGPDPGRLGYLRSGYLFSKSFETVAGASYPDRGAVGQVFANDDFCELESLGPLTRMGPGARTTHREVWQVTECPDIGSALELLLGEAPA